MTGRFHRVVLGFLAATVGLMLSQACLAEPGSSTSAEDDEDSPLAAIDPRQAVVLLADDSRLRVLLADEPIVMQTAHGKLSVPAGDVRRIEFALRLTEEEKQQVAKWIETLATPDVALRRQAVAELFALKARAYGALEQAVKEGAPDIAKGAEELLDKLWEKYPESELVGRELDVVETPDAKIAGRIVGDSIRVQTKPFGELKLKLADARTFRSLALPEAVHEERVDPKGALPDPGNLKAYEAQVGKTFLFKVTGAASGTLYGTGTYTTDSRLSAAVVHSGLMKPGETGVVKVVIKGNLPSYVGSTQNGLSSSGYGGYPGFELTRPKKTRPRK
jgi:hypothetical protein